MPLRLIEAILPEGTDPSPDQLRDDHPILDVWEDAAVDSRRRRLRILADAADTEPILDDLESRFGDAPGFRVVLLPVEAVLPRPETDDKAAAAASDDEEGRPPSPRISREELYAQLTDSAKLDGVYLLMIALSAVVCALGLLTNDVAVVIGAMVIAPLLGPLVALSLATTLADAPLAYRGFRAGAAGVLAALALSVGLGAVLPVNPEVPAIASRTAAGLKDVGLALAAGSAGTLAFTTGLPAAVIGVMVAVALVPPLVVGGLLLGAGYTSPALGAFLLTLVNLICLNLAGVVTFLGQGVRPQGWWEAERARRSTALAVGVWTVLLLVLVALILWSPAGAGIWGARGAPLP